ncbi:MAG TPA: hypothetical protein VMW52_09575, partial [Phycisphaerae bacterium]|nr:hypothetical protein [Phycisphaerae bacterium]
MAASPQMVIRVAANLQELKRNLAEGKLSIETTTKSMGRLAASLSGEKVTQKAHNIVAAVNQIGGATKLTAAEAKRLAPQLEGALDKYRLMGKEAPPAMRALATETRKVADAAKATVPATQSAATGFKTLVGGFIAAQLSVALLMRAWRTLTEFVSGSIAAYAVQELAVKKLTQALTMQGNATPRVIDGYKAMASEFQNLTKYGDEAIEALMTTLVQIGNVGPREMKKAVEATTDLAAGLGIDLNAAAILVGKAFAGETGSLSRYGIIVDKVKLKAEGITAVLDAMHQKFGGQAQADAETYSGKVEQMANAWGDFQEIIGEVIVQNPFMVSALRETIAALSDLNGSVERGIPLWKQAVNAWYGSGSITARFLDVAALNLTLAGSLDAISKAAKAAPSPVAGPDDRVGREAAANVAAFIAELNKEIAAREEATKAAEAHAKAVRAYADALGGQKVRDQVALLTAAYRLLTPAQRANRDEIAEVADALRTLQNQHATLTPELERFIAKYGTLESTTHHLSSAVNLNTGALANWARKAEDARNVAHGLQADGLLPISRSFAGFIAQAPMVEGAIIGIGKAAKRTWIDTLGLVDQVLGGITNKVAETMVVVSRTVQAVGTALSEGDWLGAIVAGVSGVVSLIGGLFGKSEGRKQLEAANQSIAALKVQVVGLYGSTAEAERLAARLGINFKDLWNNQNQAGLAYVQQQMDALAKALEEQKALAAELGQTFVARLGPSAAAAVQPLLDQLAALGGLSADVQAELLAMTGPDYLAMEAAAERYGIAQERLGQGFWQAKLDAQFGQVIADVKLLGGTFDEMGPKVSELVSQAMQYGTTLPAGMEPIVAALAEAGQLVDENGVKLEGLENLTFAETLTQGIDRVVDKLQELIDALTIGVVGGFNNVIDAADRF